MPVKVPHAWAVDGGLRTTVKHHATDASTHLYWMTDVIYLPATNEVISFGDLVISVGLIDMAFHASRRRKRDELVALDAASSDLAAPADATGTATGAGTTSATAAPAVKLDAASDTVRVMPRDEDATQSAGGGQSAREAGEHALECVDGGERTSVGVRGS
jgi:hypothetical protein